ncbi:hypothetical protein LIER_35931 [Lithospermum erythrorhizon]|uniref:Uncharacterized protein n=1 Tax=Lithospermum erythrorhizon TaxID=34254 RepID=A0AAV3P2Z9_LITER
MERDMRSLDKYREYAESSATGKKLKSAMQADLDKFGQLSLEDTEGWIWLDKCPSERLVEIFQVVKANGTIMRRTLFSSIGRTIVGSIMKKWLEDYRKEKKCLKSVRILVNLNTGAVRFRDPFLQRKEGLDSLVDFDALLSILEPFPNDIFGLSHLKKLLITKRNPRYKR